jgi:hypothetical protein
MGQIAAQTVVDQIEGRGEYVPEIAIEPEFIVRDSTGPAPGRRVRGASSAAQSQQEPEPHPYD